MVLARELPDRDRLADFLAKRKVSEPVREVILLTVEAIVEKAEEEAQNYRTTDIGIPTSVVTENSTVMEER